MAIGGLGGSGTRIVAQILIDAGCFLGKGLNRANDNIFFTGFLKCPEKYKGWIDQNNTAEIFTRLDAFYSTLIAQQVTSEAIDLYQCTREKNKARLLQSHEVDINQYKVIGWKEPNTHMFLPYLYTYDSHLRYIHVIRNGLDMAYSSNQNQLVNWGHMFNIHQPPNQEIDPVRALQFWIVSNHRSIALGRQLFRDRFLLIKFEDLCEHPEREIPRMLSFLDLDADATELAKVVSKPDSIDRYKEHDLSVFSDKQMKHLKTLGYNIDSYGKP